MPSPADLASKIARTIDHTLLRAEATRSDILRVCQEARQFGFASVCVNSAWIETAAKELQGSAPLPIAVVGFPLGAMTTTAKAFETREAVRLGAQEIDMVLPIGLLKQGDADAVRQDIQAVVEAARPYPVKVILETASLTQAEKVLACELAVQAGAAFVKTSTGFGAGGATEEDIRLMRRTVGPNLGVKASGGIRTLADALRMLRAGASRIGASASVSIIEAARNSKPEELDIYSTLESNSSASKDNPDATLKETDDKNPGETGGY